MTPEVSGEAEPVMAQETSDDRDRRYEISPGSGLDEKSSSLEEPARPEVFLGPDGLLRRVCKIGLDGAANETEIISVSRCFPWSEPMCWLSIRNSKEEEIHLIEDANQLDPVSSHAVRTALGEAAFVLKIARILSIEDEFELRQWRVEIEQGDGERSARRCQTKLSSWPRELPSGGVLIQDVANDFYLVADLEALDVTSREILYNYLD